VVSSLNSVLGTATGGGPDLVYGFDYVHHQLVVGRPGDNTVTWLTVANTDPVLPPTGANTNTFVAVAVVFLAVGTVLVATRRRRPRAI
jgi:LPXTG-motif cell wall-anchored protein